MQTQISHREESQSNDEGLDLKGLTGGPGERACYRTQGSGQACGCTAIQFAPHI